MSNTALTPDSVKADPAPKQSTGIFSGRKGLKRQ